MKRIISALFLILFLASIGKTGIVFLSGGTPAAPPSCSPFSDNFNGSWKTACWDYWEQYNGMDHSIYNNDELQLEGDSSAADSDNGLVSDITYNFAPAQNGWVQVVMENCDQDCMLVLSSNKYVDGNSIWSNTASGYRVVIQNAGALYFQQNVSGSWSTELIDTWDGTFPVTVKLQVNSTGNELELYIDGGFKHGQAWNVAATNMYVSLAQYEDATGVLTARFEDFTSAW